MPVRAALSAKTFLIPTIASILTLTILCFSSLFQNTKVEVLNALATHEYEHQNYSEANRYWRIALEGCSEKNTKAQLIVDVLVGIGSVCRKLENFEESKQFYNRALSTLSKNELKQTETYVTTLSKLAEVCKAKGEIDSAFSIYTAAYELSLETSNVPDEKRFSCKTNLLSLTTKPISNQEIAIISDELDLLSTRSPERKLALAISANNLANFLQRQMQFVPSETFYKKALNLIGSDQESELFTKLTILSNLAELYRKQGRLKDSLQILTTTLEYDRKVFGAESKSVAIDLNNLAGVYEDIGQLTLADQYFEESLRLSTKLFGTLNSDVAQTKENLAKLRHRQSRFESAETLYLEAIKTTSLLYGSQNKREFKLLVELGDLYSDCGRFDDAIATYRKAIDFGSNKRPTSSYILALNNLAVLEQRNRNFDSAKNLYTQALKSASFCPELDEENRRTIQKNADFCTGTKTKSLHNLTEQSSSCASS